MLKIRLLNGESVSVKPKQFIQVTLKDGAVAYIKNEVKEKAINQVSIREFEGIYDDIVFYPENPGCIMMDVEPLDVLKYVEDAEDDLADETDMDYSVVPGEEVSHVTLLYGLMENGNTWKEKVDQVLDGWKMNSVTIDHVDYFDIEDAYVVVAKLKTTPELLEAHGRLLMLPNAQTFSDYVPHVSLAYLKKDADVDKWVKSLNDVHAGKKLKTLEINYGDLDDKSKNFLVKHDHNHEHKFHFKDTVVYNNLTEENQVLLAQQQATLESAISRIDSQLFAQILEKIERNPELIDDLDELISEVEESSYVGELILVLAAFYLATLPIYAAALAVVRLAELGVQVPFQMDAQLEKMINELAKKAAQSHFDTIVADVKRAAQEVRDNVIEQIEDQLKSSGTYTDEEVFELARKRALEGASRQQIINDIRSKYNDIGKVRAKAIARTETNRAFTQSQYQADLQFLEGAGLMDRAYKVWKTRSDDPCEYCLILESRPPIPFKKNFQDLGTEITTTFTKKDGTTVVRKLPINYTALSAGNAHVNCACIYILKIKNQDGTFD